MSTVQSMRDVAKALAIFKMREDLEQYKMVWLLTYRRPMSLQVEEALKEAYRNDHLPLVTEALTKELCRRQKLSPEPIRLGPYWLYEGF